MLVSVGLRWRGAPRQSNSSCDPEEHCNRVPLRTSPRPSLAAPLNATPKHRSMTFPQVPTGGDTGSCSCSSGSNSSSCNSGNSCRVAQRRRRMSNPTRQPQHIGILPVSGVNMSSNNFVGPAVSVMIVGFAHRQTSILSTLSSTNVWLLSERNIQNN